MPWKPAAKSALRISWPKIANHLRKLGLTCRGLGSPTGVSWRSGHRDRRRRLSQMKMTAKVAEVSTEDLAGTSQIIRVAVEIVSVGVEVPKPRWWFWDLWRGCDRSGRAAEHIEIDRNRVPIDGDLRPLSHALVG